MRPSRNAEETHKTNNKQNRGRFVAEALENVRVPSIEVVYAEEISVAVGADGQQVLKHITCGIQRPALDGLARR